MSFKVVIDSSLLDLLLPLAVFLLESLVGFGFLLLGSWLRKCQHLAPSTHHPSRWTRWTSRIEV